MAGKNQHVVKRDDGWAARGAGNQRNISHHRTQRSEVLIHGEDGRIRDAHSYGNDPRAQGLAVTAPAVMRIRLLQQVVHASNPM